MYVSGFAAHILLAETYWNMDRKYSRPPHVITLKWEDATAEQRKQDGWIEDRVNNEKYRFRQQNSPFDKQRMIVKFISDHP